MNYFKQLIYDMRHQKMMTWISISGTAVSIFLLMVYYMVNSLPTVEISPENNRSRIYQGYGMHIIQKTPEGGENERVSGLDYSTAQKLYEGLPGVEKTAYVAMANGIVCVKEKGKTPKKFIEMDTDSKFWDMFQFHFLSGGPFTEEDCLNTTTRKAVITESVARKLFETTDVVGREVLTAGTSYLICGVVEDVSSILKNTSADIYIPLFPAQYESGNTEEAFKPCGVLKVFLQYGDDADPEAIKNEVKSRYATLNSHLKDFDAEAFYHGSPYTPEEVGEGLTSYGAKDISKKKRMQYIVYLLLLILPAFNLSGMVRGRLERRISEIGVRRAYGAKRSEIVMQFLGENFIVTLVGGAIGLLFSILFMKFVSYEFFAIGRWWTSVGTGRMITPDLSMLIKWSTFFIALGLCFILNILTATVPAWKASRIMPAEAISKSKI